MDKVELDSNVEDWEEVTIEFFISEEIINLGDLEMYMESTVVSSYETKYSPQRVPQLLYKYFV